jgi:hypothetical protein
MFIVTRAESPAQIRGWLSRLTVTPGQLKVLQLISAVVLGHTPALMAVSESDTLVAGGKPVT